MARVNAPVVTFNRGRISRLALARVDLDRARLSGEIQRNFVPRSLGSMMLRPGLEYIGGVRNSSTAILIPFIRSETDTALLELTGNTLRAWIPSTNVAAIDLVTRDGSTAALTNGDFSSSNLTGWTDADQTGATSEWLSGDFLSLVGTRFNRAIRRQSVTSSAGTHGLTTVINRGRVFFKVGSSAAGDDYINEILLRPGAYSWAVVSTGDFVIEFAANTEYRSLVESAAIESSGFMEVATTWVSSDLALLRFDQSADVIFVAADGYKQKRLERHSTNSWAVAQYEPEDGPFRGPNVTNKRLTASALSGNITLSCDQPLFQPDHDGALFQLTSIGQQVTVSPTGTDEFSDAIRVSGVGNGRIFDILIESSTGAFNATMRVQRSVGEEGSWVNVSGLTWTSSTATSFDDGLDNQIVFYRVGVGSTFTSGNPSGTLTYAAGGLTGVARIDSVVSATESSASVLINMGSTQATETWEEGSWSDFRGWPSAVALHEGRLWWAGKSRIWGSESDAFEAFSPLTEGDAAAINRSIGTGPTDDIPWLLSLGRLIVGTDGREIQAKTSSLEEPLTPANFNLRDISTQGSANVQAVKVDGRALFIQQAGVRVMETSLNQASLDLNTLDRTILVPEIGEPKLGRLVVQRQPDTRIHAVRGSTDGTVAMLLSDPAEDVAAWIDIESTGGVNGRIEEAAILPSTAEDAVYYIVRREINGATERYLERWATEFEARGGSQKASAIWRITGGSEESGSNQITSITVDGNDLLVAAVDFDDDAETTAIAVVTAINGSPFDLEAAEYSGKTFDVSGEDTVPLAIAFRPDGTKMFIAGDQGDPTIYEYALSTAWDVETASLTTSFDASSEVGGGAGNGAATGLFFKPDGTKMFVLDLGLQGTKDAEVFEYDLSTAWDISTASYSGNSFSTESETTSAQDLAFKSDGTKMYVVDQTVDEVFQYSLGTAWDISTASYDSKSFDTSGEMTLPKMIAFNSDGTKMYVGQSGELFQYTLATAWDVSTANFDSVSLDTFPGGSSENVSGQTGVAFKPDGTILVFVSDGSLDAVYRYDFTGAGGISAYTARAEGDAVVLESPSAGSSDNDLAVVVKTAGDVVVNPTFTALSGGRTLLAAGGAVEAENKIADSFVVSNSSDSTGIAVGATHLINASVVAWGDGRDLGVFTVSTLGSIDVSAQTCATSIMYGLPYEAFYKSAKLAYGAQAGSALTQRKKVSHLGLILADLHARGLEFGPSTTRLDPLPRVEDGGLISTDLVHAVYDEVTIPFPGAWDSDSRVVLKAQAPRPVTVLGMVYQMETAEKT